MQTWGAASVAQLDAYLHVWSSLQGADNAGHYVAYVMTRHGCWSVANDSHVTDGLDFEPVQKSVMSSCYMLFYSR